MRNGRTQAEKWRRTEWGTVHGWRGKSEGRVQVKLCAARSVLVTSLLVNCLKRGWMAVSAYDSSDTACYDVM